MIYYISVWMSPLFIKKTVDKDNETNLSSSKFEQDLLVSNYVHIF